MADLRPRALAAVLLLEALLTGCAATPGGDAPAHATVRGDLPALTAGLPVAVVLRSVDGKALGFGRASADVAPGRHSFLVDCTVAASGATNRYVIEAEVYARRSYRLVADATPARCNAVQLQEN